MKVSTILIITAVAASVIALTAFNLTQKAFYNKGDWRNRFYGMDYIAIKNVTEIELGDAEKFEVTIERGDKEGLYIQKGATEHVKWSRDGKKLRFEVPEKAKKGAPFRNEHFVLVLNRIDRLKTSPYVPLTFQKRYDPASVLIKGFKQDRLHLDLGNLSNVVINESELGVLQAKIGDAEGEASLRVLQSNKIDTANFNIPGKSNLSLSGANIVKTSYVLSEKATVTLNGKVLQVLK